MGNFPVGHAISTVFAAVFVWWGLRPRPTNGLRFTPSFVLASVASELPVVMLLLVVGPTALAAAEGGPESRVAQAFLALAALTVVGIVASVVLAARAAAVLESALRAELVPSIPAPPPRRGRTAVADTSRAGAVAPYGYFGPVSDGGPPSSPAKYVRPGAPPVMGVHGARDPMVPVNDARAFAASLGATSVSPVVWAELPGGLHTFDRFASVRSTGVAAGVEAFADWLLGRGLPGCREWWKVLDSSSGYGPPGLRAGRELESQRRPDLVVSQQERVLVEPLAP